ncbi:MAG TPA: PAS domain S-box protein [Desulfomonilaceae bacterium]|nr:PAS domain S-box protein [Desulfomonilaceae bacterium]
MWRGIILAIALTALAGGVRLWPLQSLGTSVAYLTFYPTVIIVALYGGFSVGLIATFFSCLTVLFAGAAMFGESFVKDFPFWLAMGVFVVNCTIILGIVWTMRRYQAQVLEMQSDLKQRNAELQAARDILQQEVKLRTAELTQTNISLEKELIESKKADEALQKARDELEVRVQERTAKLEKANEAVEAERQRLYDILETMPEMVCLLRSDYHVAFTNRSFREKFGEDNGRPCYDYRFGRKEPCEACEAYKVLETGKPHHWDFRRPDGSIIDAYDFPFTDTDGSSLILQMHIDITERKRTEEALRRLNRELRAISNCNQVLVRAVDEQTLLNEICRIVCNEAGYRMAWVGFAENDEAKNIRQVAWAGGEEDYLADVLLTCSKTERGRGPVGIALRDGESACIQDFAIDPQAAPWREGAIERGYRSCLALPLKDESESTFGILCIYSTEPKAFTPDEIQLMEELAGDLAFGINTLRTRAERKRADDAVKKSQVLLNEAQRIAHVGSWELDIVNNVLTWSDEIYRLFEIDPAKFGASYEAFLDAVHPDDRKAVDFAYTNSVKTRTPYAIDHRLRFSDGRIKHVHEQCETHYNADGKPLRSIGTVQDITERKRAEERLHLLDFALDHVNEAAFLIDENARPRFVNEGACRVLGYTRSELLGLGVPDFDPDFPMDSWNGHWNDLKAQGSLTFEGRHKTRDGRIFPIEINANYFEYGGQGYNLALVRDITERKRGETERESLITELEAKNAELERFAYTVSHDLRSPLITIKTFLGFVTEQLAKGNTQELKPDLDRIDKAADKMGQLLGEILEISRVGRMFNPPSEVLIAELVNEALELLSGRIAQHGIEAQIVSDLPVLYVDRPRVQEVFQNLIENSIKFMGDQPQPRIEIGARQDGEETVLFVRDNGMGIQPNFHEKVFGLFDKLDPQTEGTGLGLALVKRIVEVHGGRIWVESEGTGHGSTFCFTLPSFWSLPPDRNYER